MGAKRRRIALSCVDCRRRKVKCDRTMPACIRCQKGGVGDKCRYVPYEGEEALKSSPNGDSVREGSAGSWIEEAEDYARIASIGPNAGLSTLQSSMHRKPTQADTIQRLEQKIADLESLVETGRTNVNFATSVLGLPTPSSTIMAETPAKTSIADMQQILLRGKSFKTQYYGPSHYASILLTFDELSTFLKDIMKPCGAVLNKAKYSQDTYKLIRRDIAHQLSLLSHEHDALLDLIPDKALADILVQQYLDSFETIYRALHVPTFLGQYKAFWEAPFESPTSFVVVLLLTMATVLCIKPQEQTTFLGRSSGLRERATKWVAACEAWLEDQSHKHVTLVTYQVRVLLFIAKRTNTIKVKRGWSLAGQLLRLGMGAGLHREPDPTTGKISIFEQEMRRRIWATILELELLTAIDKGMPPALTAADWDCQPPSNIHDEEFDENSLGLPDSRPYSEFTRTSYLYVSAHSVALRLEMLAVINRIKPTLTLEIAAQYDMRTRQALAEIPNWQTGDADFSRPCPRLASALAKLQLIEFSILTYQPFATIKEAPSRQFFSRAAFRDASAQVLELHKRLEATGDLTLRFVRQDAFRAGLSICYDLCTAESPSSSLGSSSVTFNRERAMELLEHSLTIQEARVMSLGQGTHAYWVTCAALNLAYSKQNPHEPRDKYVQQVADTVSSLNEKVVALQDPTLNLDGISGNDVGEALAAESQAALAKVARGGGMAGALEAQPVSDIRLDFGTFNLTDFVSMDNFWDFGDI